MSPCSRSASRDRRFDTGGSASRRHRGAATRFPNLKTLPPHDLRFDVVSLSGTDHHVLRFANTVWNAGPGPLELRADPATETLSQRLYDGAGGFVDRELPEGAFVFHPEHDHYHFVDFARYELWERGKERAKRVRRLSMKVTFCVLDEHAMEGVSVEPAPRRYSTCERDVQGLSVGWADEYDADRWGQWIDLGHEPLRDGRYLLRSVADPRNLLGEGGRRQNSERNNKAVSCFAVEGGALRSTRC